MRQFKLTFLVVALMMILSNVGWGQILNENFSYTAGTDLTANGWNITGTNATPTLGVTASTISYAGYLSSGTGNEVTLATS